MTAAYELEKILKDMQAADDASNVRLMRREPSAEVQAVLQAMLVLASPSFNAWYESFETFVEHFEERQETAPFPGSPEKLREAVLAYLPAAFSGPFDDRRNRICARIGLLAHQSGVNPFIFMSGITRLTGGMVDFLRAHLAPETADLHTLSYFSRMLTLDLAVILEAFFRMDRMQRDAIAHIDELTKFANEQKLRQELQRRMESPEPRCPLAVFGLPRIHKFEEDLGHESADRILQEIAARMAPLETQGWFLARARHNMFVLLPPQMSDDAFHAAVRDLHRQAGHIIHVDGKDVHPEIAVGIVMPGNDTDAAALLRRCDAALRQAAKSPDGMALYNAAMERFSFEELILLKDFKAAIQTDQFSLHYQPQIALDTNAVAGAEALARWTHPSRGPVPPGKFIPLAEKTFLIHALTRRLLTDAVKQAKAWEQKGMALTVSVNIAADILQDPDFPALVESILQEAGLPAGLLSLEITEPAILANPDRTRNTLQRLRDAGLRIAIDDFGQGYSSFAFLRDLPVDEVKIDRDFVFGMLKDPRDAGIVEATIRLCRGLGIAVSAEGVEDEATLARLREMGCQYAQGFVLARPMPPELFEQWIRKRAQL